MRQTNLFGHHAHYKCIGVLRDYSRSQDIAEFFFGVEDIDTNIGPVGVPLAAKVSFALSAFASIPRQINDDESVFAPLLQNSRMNGKVYSFLIVATAHLNGLAAYLVNQRLFGNVFKDCIKLQHLSFGVRKQDLFFAKHGYKYSNQRGLEPRLTDRKHKKKSSENKFWNFSIWNKLNQTMVREIDVRWNQIEASTELMYAKLVKLGFTHENGEVVIRKPHDE